MRSSASRQRFARRYLTLAACADSATRRSFRVHDALRHRSVRGRADDDVGRAADFLRAHAEFRGVSVRVDGTFNVASWFKCADGTVVDPTNGANAVRIGQNIGFSFAAFGDDDRNGFEDRR
jgi:hypothetical protein